MASGSEDENILLPEPGVVLIDEEALTPEEKQEIRVIEPPATVSFPEIVVKKAIYFEARDRFIHKVFNEQELPSSERIVHDFSCQFKNQDGRIFITYNYVLFCNAEISNPKKLFKWRLPMNDITDIRREQGKKNMFTLSIDENNSISHHFTHFFHRKKAFFLAHYLWIYTPTLVITKHIPRKSNNQNTNNEKQSNKNNNNNNNNNNENNNKKNNAKNERKENAQSEELTGKWLDFSKNVFRADEERKKEKYNVKVTSTKETIGLLHEITEVEKGIINKLRQQDEMVDRIRKNVADVEDNIQKADNDIEVMDSTLLQMYELIRSTSKEEEIERKRKEKEEEEKKQKEEAERKLKEKHQQEEAEWRSYDIPILLKNKLGAMQHAIFRFTDTHFYCFDPYENEDEPVVSKFFGHYDPEFVEHRDLRVSSSLPPLNNHTYYYEDVASVVMRSRPLHVDIRFKEHTELERFRCMTSYQQMLTNEMVLRNASIKVVFEPHGYRPFEYGSISLRRQIKLKPSRDTNSRYNYSFLGPIPRITENIIVNAPVEVKEALDKQDEGLEEIVNQLHSVHLLANDIGRIEEASIEKLAKTQYEIEDATSNSKKAKAKVSDFHLHYKNS